MNICTPIEERRSGAVAARNLLSLKEVVTLAGVPEKRVRKDIETGVLAEPRVIRLSDARLAFGWHYVVFVAAVYGNDHLNGRLRKLALSKLDQLAPSLWLMCEDDEAEPPAWHCGSVRAATKRESCEHWHIDIDHYVSLNLNRVLHNVVPRMSVYSTGLSRSEERDDILGGEAVFRDTRLSVAHVGKMVESGERVSNILEDYPYLNEDDVRFAHLYYRAHPTVGRPRASGEGDYAEATVG